MVQATSSSPNLNVLVAISKSMQAVELRSNKSPQVSTGE